MKMPNKEIIANNKLIVKFMDWKIHINSNKEELNYLLDYCKKTWKLQDKGEIS